MMVKSLLNQNFVPPLPKNLQLTFGGLASGSLLKSDLVISYHSTALIECLLVGVQVFVPLAYVQCGWEDFIHQYDGLLPTFCDFKEIRDFIVKLNGSNTGQDLTLEKSKLNEFLERSVGNPDGLAGLRAYEILQNYF
jgi:hypothetical protein